MNKQIQNKTNKSHNFQVGERVVGITPGEDSRTINGFVTAATSLGVYVTDGVKTKFDRLKVEASEFFNAEVCRIHRA